MIATDGKTEQIIADFPILARPTSRGKRLVYLDSAATSQKPRAVIQALVDYYEQYNANIHRGVYEIAARATAEFERARVKLARFIGADAREVVWVRNTTEAINLVAYSWGNAHVRAGDAILLTELEHHSDLVPWQLLAERTGAQLRFIPTDDSGRYVLDDLDALLDGCKLVACAHVSNTLGTILPLETVVPRAHAAGAVVLVDGAQGAPHLPVDVKAIDADFYTFSGHKMLGPTGIGVLYGKHTLLEAMPPFFSGGDMIRKVEYAHTTFSDPPRRFEAGTSNNADAIAFGVAVDYLHEVGMPWVREHERRLTAYALERLAGFEARGLAIYGPRDPATISGVISFNLADVHAHDLASILDTEGICVRAGHHCTMPLMEKMGWAATARASFYIYNTEADIDALCDGLEKAARVFGI
ncbi:MAG: SufS family cysteine desulfurase [Candidatus Eremiobacteraeota bacterium]|nr:SufS family cysteine desulfurase [Candidatus Eremiobacteraeota bacterium]